MKKFFLAVIAIMLTASVSAQFYIYLSGGGVIKADSISLIAPSEQPTPSGDGMLSGEFSVSTSHKVHFSQGNLQYVGTWQFAEHQWEFFGDDQYDNHRDLLGWGTGYEPNKVSTNNYDYSTFVDWGLNLITNGGNQSNLWRTLTKAEWVYLFYNRTNAVALFGLGTVNGVNGTILLPDNWVLPEDVSFTPSIMLGLADQGMSYLDTGADHFADNTYTVEQWAVMESAGAVFLPAAGYRNAFGMQKVGTGGYYWSTQPYDASYCFFFSFESSSLGPQYYGNRLSGQAVRLVRY